MSVGVARVVLGGLNIGVHRNCSIAAAVAETLLAPRVDEFVTVEQSMSSEFGAPLQVSIAYKVTV